MVLAKPVHEGSCPLSFVQRFTSGQENSNESCCPPVKSARFDRRYNAPREKWKLNLPGFLASTTIPPPGIRPTSTAALTRFASHLLPTKLSFNQVPRRREFSVENYNPRKIVTVERLPNTSTRNDNSSRGI